MESDTTKQFSTQLNTRGGRKSNRGGTFSVVGIDRGCSKVVEGENSQRKKRQGLRKTHLPT